MEVEELDKALVQQKTELTELQARLHAMDPVLENAQAASPLVRERRTTAKMADYRNEEAAKRERKFFKQYGILKTCVWKVRQAIKSEVDERNLNSRMRDLETKYAKFEDLFEDLRRFKTPTQEIRERMDRGSAMTRDSLNALEEVLGSIDGPLEDRDEILTRLLKHDYAKSVYGSTVFRHSREDDVEPVSLQRIKLEADLAAKEAEIRENKKIEMQRMKLKNLEDARDLEVMKAKVQAYHKVEVEERLSHSHNSDHTDPTAHSNVSESEHEDSTQPQGQGCAQNTQAQQFDAKTFSQTLADSMQRNRLPVPVPPVFSGNPLEFLDFKRSFMLLIENRGILPEERMYFLKQYLTGSARDAVEGFFYGTTEEAYQAAWRTLQDRYGHPFKIQQAFRAKLDNWPKVQPRDASSLQRFADFLKSCDDAMAFVPGMRVLDDCLENRKILSKLPDFLIDRWNRTVTEALDISMRYPTFNEFVRFMLKEARIANNPVSSVHALKSQENQEKGDNKSRTKDTSKGKRTTFATSIEQHEASNNNTTLDKASKNNNATNKEKRPCILCHNTGHPLEKCQRFLDLDDQEKFVKDNGLCFGCLKKGHRYKDCRRRRNVRLHKPDESVTQKENVPNEEKVFARSYNVHLGQSSSTSMVIPVWISTANNPSCEVLTYALLDTQSDASFIIEDLVESLHVQPQPVCLKLSTLTSSATINCGTVTDLLIRGMRCNTIVRLNRCYTRDQLPIDRSHIPHQRTAEAWPHLRFIAHEIPVLQNCGVGLLIGYNCPQALAPKQTVLGGAEEPFAVRTDLGWSIVGSSETEDGVVSHCFRASSKEIPLPSPRDALRILEGDFAEKHGDKSYSQEDLQFIKEMEKSIVQCNDGHLMMALPFRERPKLPNNRKLAEIRLSHLHRKMKGDSKFREQYEVFMKDIIAKGYAEKVPDAGNLLESVNYIPHHGVYHAKKGKLRVVFDCSARYGGTSLNDHLLKGPDLTNGLLGVLCRFRKFEIAILCDIEKMFYQFRVHIQDRDFLRFLWWEDNIDSKPSEFRMTVHLFGAASSPGCSNYGLKHLANKYKEEFPLASRFIEREFYVDDGVTSVPTVNSGIKLAREARELCKKGGVRLHKFISNNRDVLESIPVSERAEEIQDLNLQFDELPVERALGLTWKPTSDTFFFKFKLKNQPLTRRGILSTVASFYDPLGFLAPVIIEGKLILQKMCGHGSGWDEPISDNLKPRWEHWVGQLCQLEKLSIQRCYYPKDFGKPIKIELHHFSDASTYAYGQCSYLRFINEEGTVHCCLVFAKARVAPIKVTTIPRLELTAAMVSAKVSTMLKEELDYQELQDFFWTDSTVVLGYINNKARRFHTFVANRVELIHERTKPEQWNYINTEENPADLASRGLGPSELIKSMWFKGPAFLWKHPRPDVAHSVPALQIGDPEVRATALTTKCTPQMSILDRLARFSDWSRIISAFTSLRRLVLKVQPQSLVQEQKDTENFILKLVQKEAFFDDIYRLSNNKPVSTSSVLYNLNPFVDELGILRVGGRLRKAKLPDAVKNPIILPRTGHVTQVILAHFHRKASHQGRGQTLNMIRAHGFWVLGGSRAVAELLRNCVVCRKLRRPVEDQQMASLPEERVEPSAPFTYVGMDCFGPFKIKRGRSEIKRYGLLFTCLCSRAIHIEMLDDMTTDAFINALRCFLAIRGSVKVIRSDQGTNFVGANNEMNVALKEMDTEKLERYLANKQCEFVFNAPQSSHAGGIWERQIRTVKEVLKSTINLCPERLDDASLRTLLYESMALVNSRPLSPVCLSDPFFEPLTPNHLLTMKPTLPSPPPGKFVMEDVYARKRWRRIQYLLEQFWSRWRREYVLNLQQRQKWRIRKRNMKVGDLVLLKDITPRMEWPLGLVKSVTVDDDGLVRKVRVEVASKDLDRKGRLLRPRSELERPVQKLVLLRESDDISN